MVFTSLFKPCAAFDSAFDFTEKIAKVASADCSTAAIGEVIGQDIAEK